MFEVYLFGVAAFLLCFAMVGNTLTTEWDSSTISQKIAGSLFVSLLWPLVITAVLILKIVA